MDKETCREAAGELNKNLGNLLIYRDNAPKGCYESESNIFFNSHSTGSRQSGKHQICKVTGKVELVTCLSLPFT